MAEEWDERGISYTNISFVDISTGVVSDPIFQLAHLYFVCFFHFL